MNEKNRCYPLIYNCYGMTGPTGATGPTGPERPVSINSILVAYDRTQSVISKGFLNLGNLVNISGDSFTFNSPNEIIINEQGTYLINFSTIINNTNTSGDLGVSLLINNVVVPTASEYILSQSAAFTSLLQHNYNASVGDKVVLENLSSVANNYHDAALSIIKLN